MPAGRVIATDTAATFADGVACRLPDPDAIEVITKGAARVVTISEDDAAEAMLVLYRTTHNVPEPAGALALAGLLQERSAATGKRLTVVQTGGNADSDLLSEVLSGRTPARVGQVSRMPPSQGNTTPVMKPFSRRATIA